MRPLDTLASERELSTRTEKRIDYQIPNGHGSDFLRIYWVLKCNRCGL